MTTEPGPGADPGAPTTVAPSEALPPAARGGFEIPPGSFSGYMHRWWQKVRAGDLGSLPIIVGLVIIVVVFGTLAIITFNLLVDILYAWIDPRIRLS